MPTSSSARFRSSDVVEILGISRRQLQYWAQTDLVAPSSHTRGGHRRYSFEDLVALKTAKRLIDAGVSVQRLRASIRSLRETLPQVKSPLAELVLVATGDIVLVFRDGTAFEAVSGQEWVFEVAQLQREIEEWKRAREASEPKRARTVRRVERSRSA
jgi:DNA-binding transcriptional MerR regulator